MKISKAVSHNVTIYIAGDLQDAKRSLKAYCAEEGFCVSLQACEYIYTGGCEEGVKVGLINYPRFVRTPEELDLKAREIASKLLKDLYQQSCTIVTPAEALWLSLRPEDN